MGFNTENSHQSGADVDVSTFRRALPQFIAVGVKNVVLFGYGMTLGFPTIVIPAIKGGDGRENGTEGDFILSTDEISWLSSINLLCVPLGCFFSGFLTEPTGKRRAMQLVNIPMFISWLLFYFSTSVRFLYAGLCLSGLSGGLMEAPVLTYVAEVTQPQFRGMLAATGTTCVITGIFVQFILGKFLTWRAVALVSCSLPILTIIALFFVPESPYWLLTKGRVDEAKKSLAWLRGWVPFEKVTQEFDEIDNVLSARRREAEEAKLKPFYQRLEPFMGRGFIAPFILVSATFFIGHFSGKTPLQTYAVQIFSTLKAPIDKYYATILLGAAELVGAFSCVILVHITGKRPLVFVSLIGTGLCFFGAATYAWYLDSVPGFIVENVVANYSLPDHLQRRNFVNQKNITFDAMTPNSNDTEFTTELPFSMTTEPYLNLENETTTNSMETTTFRFNADTNQTVAVNQTDLNKIFLSVPNTEENKYLWLPLALLLTGSFFAHLGIRIIPWMLIGEVFPVNVRSAASGLSSGIGYIFAFLSNKVFLQMLATLTLPGTFWFYSAVAITGCVILYFVLPETENRKLIDIEAHFLGKRSLSEKEITKDESVNNNNTISNGFDLVTVLPQMIGTKNPNSDATHGASEGESNGVESHRLSVPEVMINQERSPNVGSKRYKNRVTDTIRSRNSLTSNDDVQDTRL